MRRIEKRSAKFSFVAALNNNDRRRNKRNNWHSFSQCLTKNTVEPNNGMELKLTPLRRFRTHRAMRYGAGIVDEHKANADRWDLRRTFPPLLRSRIGLKHEQGVELFYNIAVTPWLHVTPDLQFIDAGRDKARIIGPNRKAIGTAIVAGLRIKVDF